MTFFSSLIVTIVALFQTPMAAASEAKSFYYQANGCLSDGGALSRRIALPPILYAAHDHAESILDSDTEAKIVKLLEETQKLALKFITKGEDLTKSREWASEQRTIAEKCEKILSPAQKMAAEDFLDCHSLMSSGIREYCKARSITLSEDANERLSKRALLEDLRSIESEVLEALLDGLDGSKIIEIEAIFAASRPDRVPPISTLWESLHRLESDGENSSEEDPSELIPVLKLRSGLLKVVRKIPTNPLGELMNKLSVVRSISDDRYAEKIRDMMLLVLAKQQEISTIGTKARLRNCQPIVSLIKSKP